MQISMRSLPLLRPRILERYVAREYLKLFSLTLLTFVSVFLIVDFFEKIDRLVQAKIPLSSFFLFFWTRLAIAAGHVIPAAVMIGVILTFALMSRRNEIMAIKTSGLDVMQLVRPVFFGAGAGVALLLALNLYLIPWSQQSFDQFWQVQIEKRPLPTLTRLEQFWYKGDNAIYNIMLFRKDTQTLEGVKVYLFDRSFRLLKIVAAARAQWEGTHWRFTEGLVQNFGPQESMQGERFQELTLTLTERPEDFATLERKVTQMDQTALYYYIQRLERFGYESTVYRVDFHSRISQSMAPLILVVLGLGLVLRREKPHIPATVALGTAVMFGYWLLFGFCTSFGRAGHWPVLLADWLPHVGFAAATIYLLRKVSR